MRTPLPSRHWLTAAPLALLLLTSPGCGSDDSPTTRPTTGSTSGSTTGSIDLTPGTARAVELEPMDPALLPAGFPAGLPVAAGELRLADARGAGAFDVLVVTAVHDTTAALNGAVQLLTDAGWADRTASPISPQLLVKGSAQVTVSTYPESGAAVLRYQVGPPKP